MNQKKIATKKQQRQRGVVLEGINRKLDTLLFGSMQNNINYLMRKYSKIEVRVSILEKELAGLKEK